jgi:hypothetical protein
MIDEIVLPMAKQEPVVFIVDESWSGRFPVLWREWSDELVSMPRRSRRRDDFLAGGTERTFSCWNLLDHAALGSTTSRMRKEIGPNGVVTGEAKP